MEILSIIKHIQVNYLFYILLSLFGCNEEDRTSYNENSCISPTWNNYKYDVVQIGKQCWFSENLRTELYRNGEEINYVVDDTEWKLSRSGARCFYNNDINMENFYGQLYNGYAVTDKRKICPTGWNVPTDDDWENLVEFISEEAAYGIPDEGWDGMAYWEVGEFLKDSCCWWPEHILNNSNFKSTNNFGFDAIPSGERSFGGYFLDAGEYGSSKWWTSTDKAGEIPYRFVTFKESALYDAYAMRTRGFAVRCMHDLQ